MNILEGPKSGEIRGIPAAIIACLLASFECSSAAQPVGIKAPVTPEERIARLGTALCGTENGRPVVSCPFDDEPGFDSDLADIKELAKTPALSVKLLIADLHTIPDSQQAERRDGSQTERTLQEIRALRFLTGGLDFRAKSTHVFGKSDEEKNRKYWLEFDHPNSVAFFGTWPPHGRIYIAPKDAQERIIAKWRRWYAMTGATFDYRLSKILRPRSGSGSASPREWRMGTIQSNPNAVE